MTSPTTVPCRTCGAPAGRACAVDGKRVTYCPDRVTDVMPVRKVTHDGNGQVLIDGVPTGRTMETPLPRGYSVSASRGGKTSRRGTS